MRHATIDIRHDPDTTVDQHIQGPLSDERDDIKPLWRHGIDYYTRTWTAMGLMEHLEILQTSQTALAALCSYRRAG